MPQRTILLSMLLETQPGTFARIKSLCHLLSCRKCLAAGSSSTTTMLAAGRNNLTLFEVACKFCVRFGFQSSSMVERPAVNRNVVGSSPTSGGSFYALVSARVSAKEGGVFGATVSGSV